MAVQLEVQKAGNLEAEVEVPEPGKLGVLAGAAGSRQRTLLPLSQVVVQMQARVQLVLVQVRPGVVASSSRSLLVLLVVRLQGVWRVAGRVWEGTREPLLQQFLVELL